MSLIDWFIPLNLKIGVLKLVGKIAKFTSNENNLGTHLEIPNNKSDRCYILACGPSIKEMDLEILSGETCISVSNFFVHQQYKKINPSYHLFAPSHLPITEKQFLDWFRDCEKYLSDNQTIIVSANDKHIIDNHNVFKKNLVHTYKFINEKPEKFNQITLAKPLPIFATVAHLAIYLAISLGFKKIYLLGVDHNWLFNFGKSNHFYEEDLSKLVKGGYNEYQNIDLESEFISHAKLWNIYKSINVYANENRIKIYNATPNSFLDVFEFKDINKID